MANLRAWSLIALPADKRQYGGNTGYTDDVEQIYRYDSNVPNHKQIARGDLVFIRDAENVMGMARIENILVFPAEKQRQRCPVCKQTGIKYRKSKNVSWRCADGHEFNEPFTEKVAVTGYEAHYKQSFVHTPRAVSISELKQAALRPNDQLSIEEINLGAIESALFRMFPETRILIESFVQEVALDESDAASTADALIDVSTPFVATMTDTRDTVLRSIRIRRGQKAFRDKLIRRYGPRCVASGCELMDIIEAAHIDPYRGKNDNHPENGLLLRADLHTLFDLNLMGIDPDGLTLRFHPKIKDNTYRCLDGRSLRLSGLAPPAHAPIKRRWDAYTLTLRRAICE
jgi:hypothetical protein